MITHKTDKTNGYDPQKRRKIKNNGICHLIDFTISSSCKAKV